MNAMHNETGPIKSCTIDINQFSCDDFMRYLEDSYDPDNPTKYDLALAQAFAHASEKHNKEMKELSSRLAAATANTMTSGASEALWCPLMIGLKKNIFNVPLTSN